MFYSPLRGAIQFLSVYGVHIYWCLEDVRNLGIVFYVRLMFTYLTMPVEAGKPEVTFHQQGVHQLLLMWEITQ